MHKEKYTRIVAIVMISFLLIVALYYFIPDKIFWNPKQKKITAEQIESLEKIIPEEMFKFLFNNDSLNICLNSMADHVYRSKDSTVYDSVIPGNYTHYIFVWNTEAGKWRMLSRYFIFKDSIGLFSVWAEEDYLAYNNSWEKTICDSFFYDDKGEFIMQRSLNGDIEKYNHYENDSVKIIMHIMSEYSDTKTVETKDKETGEIIKRQEFSGDNSKDEWTLKEEEIYSYERNNKHTRTFSKNYGENELKYSKHDINTTVNDSLFVSKGYYIDSLGIETLRDSSIYVKRKDKSKLTKYFLFSEEQKLIRENIDSSYFDADSNEYFYTKSANYSSRHGYISFSIVDSLNRLKYYKSQHWNRDSTNHNNYEKFAYFTPKSNVTVKFEITQTEEGEKRIRKNIEIELLPDQFSSYKTNLYWSEEGECYRTLGITLKKLNSKGKVIEEIEIE